MFQSKAHYEEAVLDEGTSNGWFHVVESLLQPVLTSETSSLGKIKMPLTMQQWVSSVSWRAWYSFLLMSNLSLFNTNI